MKGIIKNSLKNKKTTYEWNNFLRYGFKLINTIVTNGNLLNIIAIAYELRETFYN